MAARNSTSKARSSRKKSASTSKVTSVTRTIPQAIEDAIEAERTRLMTAHTLLSCAALAMDGEDLSFEGPHYLSVLELSRDLVNEAINNLEPLALESASEDDNEPADDLTANEIDVTPRRKDRVREPITSYWTH